MSARRERRGLGSVAESGVRGGRGTEAVGVTWARAGPASAKWLEVRRVIHGRAKGCATLRVRPAAAARERKPREHLSPPRNREHPARTAPPTTTTPNVTRESAALPPRPPQRDTRINGRILLAGGSRECPVSRVPGPVAGSRRGRRLASCAGPNHVSAVCQVIVTRRIRVYWWRYRRGTCTRGCHRLVYDTSARGKPVKVRRWVVRRKGTGSVDRSIVVCELLVVHCWFGESGVIKGVSTEGQDRRSLWRAG